MTRHDGTNGRHMAVRAVVIGLLLGSLAAITTHESAVAQSPTPRVLPVEQPAAKPDANAPAEATPTAKLLSGVPTLGGMYFWADEFAFHDWRIQRHVTVNGYRLLDGLNQQHAVGSLEQCRTALEKIKQRDQLPPMRGKMVVVLHGLGGNRMMMCSLTEHLRKQNQWSVCNATYPSVFRDLDAHAQSFGRLMESLDGVEEIYLVAHSMGNVVIRRWWHDAAKQQDDAGRPRTDRVKRIVMIGPPNQGADLASDVSKIVPVQYVLGPAAAQLGPAWKNVVPNLATPSCEFGILAGGCGTELGYNPQLKGDDDGVLTVASTRLSGARDFLRVKGLHVFLPMQSDVKECTVRFLKHGYFVEADKRDPIP